MIKTVSLRPIEDAPKDGTDFEVYVRQIWRWKTYKAGAPKELLAKGRRWQKLNQFGGWENTDEGPIGWVRDE